MSLEWRLVLLGVIWMFIFPDFLGFYKVSNLVYVPLVDISLTSMTLTTCLVLCNSTSDQSQVAILVETRCICAKGLLEDSKYYLSRPDAETIIWQRPHDITSFDPMEYDITSFDPMAYNNLFFIIYYFLFNFSDSSVQISRVQNQQQSNWTIFDRKRCDYSLARSVLHWQRQPKMVSWSIKTTK